MLDLEGRGKSMLMGLVIFAIGLALCGVATNR
jgi:MFS family permease